MISHAATSLELLEMECSFNILLTGTREKQGHAMMRSQMDNLRVTVLKQIAMQPQNQPRPASALPAANVPLPHISEDVQVTWGARTRCRQRMPMLSIRTAVTQRLETDYKHSRGATSQTHWAILCQGIGQVLHTVI